MLPKPGNMGEPGSFTSLMAMVESHLSKTSLSTSTNSASETSYSLPNICSVRNSNSETLLPPPATVMQLPRFEVKNSEVTEILAHQVKNMLMARENALNEEKEKQRLVNDLNKMKLKDENNDDYMIDLSASIMRPGPSPPQRKQELKTFAQSNSSSVSSLNSKIKQKSTKKLQKPKIEPLPTCEDMSYILYQKIKKGKCSSFGKVLSARLKPVAAPYLRTNITHPDVVPFDFLTPSPCDINKERRLLPTVDPYAHMNMMERIMAMTEDEVS